MEAIRKLQQIQDFKAMETKLIYNQEENSLSCYAFRPFSIDKKKRSTLAYNAISEITDPIAKLDVPHPQRIILLISVTRLNQIYPPTSYSRSKQI